MISTAHDEGREAWEAAGDDATNPYPSTSAEGRSWAIGYAEARAEEMAQ